MCTPSPTFLCYALTWHRKTFNKTFSRDLHYCPQNGADLFQVKTKSCYSLHIHSLVSWLDQRQIRISSLAKEKHFELLMIQRRLFANISSCKANSRCGLKSDHSIMTKKMPIPRRYSKPTPPFKSNWGEEFHSSSCVYLLIFHFWEEKSILLSCIIFMPIYYYQQPGHPLVSAQLLPSGSCTTAKLKR